MQAYINVHLLKNLFCTFVGIFCSTHNVYFDHNLIFFLAQGNDVPFDGGEENDDDDEEEGNWITSSESSDDDETLFSLNTSMED